jgi:prolyl-tRNA synthetase
MIAPIQVVIVPIIFKKKAEKVLEVAQEVYTQLRNAGLRVHLDNRAMSNGRKYYHWEIRGVPLRVEIGPRDVEKGNVALVRRDTREKIFIAQDSAIKEINNILGRMQDDLWTAAKQRHASWVYQTQDLEEALDLIDTNKGVVEIPFCGSEECAQKVEQRLDGLKFLGIPARYLSSLNEKPAVEENLFCAQCMEPVQQYWRISKSY